MEKDNTSEECRTEIKSYFCKQCRRYFESIEEYRSREHKIIHGGIIKSYFCKQCLKYFDFIQEYRSVEHKVVHRAIKSASSKTHSRSSKNKHFCLVFTQGILTPSKISSRKTAFDCCICLHVFESENELKVHMPICKNEAATVCSLCGKQFSERDDFLAHMFSHRGLRPLKCDECAKRFAERSELQKHLEIHKKTSSYKCKKCSKTFIDVIGVVKLSRCSNETSQTLKHL